MELEMKRGISLLLIVVVVVGCVRGHGSISAGDGSFTFEEAEIGAAIHRKILETFQVYHEPVLNEYVRGIGERIAQMSRHGALAYRFIILEDERLYATHAPGGYVYITTGFFKFLTSEVELAGILAHEIGALQYRDPEFSKTKKVLERLMETGSVIGPAFGTIGALSVTGLLIVGLVVMREKSVEEQIYLADRLALEYLVSSGFDPQGLVHLLRRMQNPLSPFRPYLYDYLQSHPVSQKRFDKIDDAFGNLDLGNRHFDAGRETYLNLTQSVRQ